MNDSQGLRLTGRRLWPPGRCLWDHGPVAALTELSYIETLTDSVRSGRVHQCACVVLSLRRDSQSRAHAEDVRIYYS